MCCDLVDLVYCLAGVRGSYWEREMYCDLVDLVYPLQRLELRIIMWGGG